MNQAIEIPTKFKPFRVSPVTRQIQKYLEDIFEGDVVKYEDLSALVGLDCKPGGNGYSYVVSALTRLERRGHHFANIQNVGYRKLNPNETIEDRSRRLKLAGKQAKRHTEAISSVDYERLGAIERLEFKAAMVFGRLSSRILSSRVKTKLIEELKKQPETQQIDYEGLTDLYVRKMKTET